MQTQEIPLGINDMLLRAEAARYVSAVLGVRVPPSFLARRAVTGDGPVFYKWGQLAVYPKPGLDAWMKTRLGPARRCKSDVVTRGKAHTTH